MAELQRRGVRAALICSDAFLPLARVQRLAANVPDLPLIVIKHPLGGISLDDVGRRAAQALPQILELVRGAQHD